MDQNLLSYQQSLVGVVATIATFISVICGALAYLVVTPRLYEAKVRLILDDKQVSIS